MEIVKKLCLENNLVYRDYHASSKFIGNFATTIGALSNL